MKTLVGAAVLTAMLLPGLCCLALAGWSSTRHGALLGASIAVGPMKWLRVVSSGEPRLT